MHAITLILCSGERGGERESVVQREVEILNSYESLFQLPITHLNDKN